MASAGQRQVRQRLVAADVERAQGDPPAAERRGDLPVGRLLLVDVRCSGPAEEQELGAHEPDQVGAGRCGGHRVGGRADVGADEHGDAVAGDGRGRGLLPRLRFPLGARGGAVAERGQLRRAPGRRPARRWRRRARSVVPSGTSSTAAPAATTAGTPRARSRIALCAVGLPAASTTPATRSGSSAAACAGVRSAATRTAGGPPSSTVATAGPPTSAPDHLGGDGTHVGRARREVGIWQRPRAPPRRARRRPPRPAAADAPAAIAARASASSAGSSSSSRCASKIAASSGAQLARGGVAAGPDLVARPPTAPRRGARARRPGRRRARPAPSGAAAQPPRFGPIADPGRRRQGPARGRPRRGPRVRCAGAAVSGSSKCRPASPSTASTAAPAAGPVALTSTRCPAMAPSAARLGQARRRRSTADPVVALRTRTSAPSRSRTSAASRAAGRACSPCGVDDRELGGQLGT